MKITQEQMTIIKDLVDEGEMALGASFMRNTPFYILKAINEEIKANGVDWQYELNAKGKTLQDLYEKIYDQNRELLKEDGTYPMG